MADKPKEFWNHIKKLNKRSNLNSNNIPSDVWVEHFSNLNRKDPENDPQSQEYCREIEVEVNPILSQTPVPVTKCHITDRPFTLDEVKWGLRQLKKGKASGTDGISNDILICCKETIAPVIVTLFGRLLQTQHYPNQWSISVMVPIHKSG